MTRLQVEQRRFVRACTAGLSEKTALVALSVQGDVSPAADRRIRAAAPGLYPAEPLYGITETDWPGAFLVHQPAGPPADVDDGYLGRLGEWVVALTVAIQRWGRDPVWRGRVLAAGQGRLRLAIPWHRPDFFDAALSVALELVSDWCGPVEGSQSQPAWQSWLSDEPDRVHRLDRYFDGRWPDIQAGGFAPNTLRFMEAAARRQIPVDVLPSFVQIGWGAHSLRFDMATTGQTSWIAKTMAKNKLKTSRTLANAGIPVPPCGLVSDLGQARRAAEELGWPVVVKPLDQDGGNAVAPGIRDPDRLAQAFDAASRLSPGRVLVEQHCPGADHRLLVVGGRVLQVARRRAAGVVGDGVRTVGQLIGQLNDDPRRGSQRYSLLKTLVIDDDLGDCLVEQGLTPDSVPPAGQAVWLSRVANISSGGTAEDVTGITHPDNAALATRAARIIGLDIAGVDFLCPDISRSWREVGGVICEVNAQPGFRPHWLADPDRDINGEILEMLFGGRPARIPTAAITGTNGKTTTAEMLYRIWTVAGRITGVCTTARVRIGDQIVSTDNLSGQPGARIILNDPAVEAAVLEMPRKGMIYFGHHCDRYDVAALLNVRDDHIGADGIETLEQMAELKAEVIERATAAIVVNADDPLCMAMRSRAGTDRHILVTEHPASVADHRRQGGEAVFSAEREGERWMVLCAGGDETPVLPMRDIPATMNGLMRVNESNAMFAAALAWAQGIGVATIREALSSFDASPETNPGRFNFIDDLPFTLLLDYAHNPDGVQELCSFVAKFPAAGRRILCARSLGNHSAAQFAEVAPLLARTFDEFFLSCVVRYVVKCPDYAGADPVGTMLAMSRQRLLEQTVAAESVVCVPDPDELLANCFAVARPGDLVVVLGNYYKLVEQIEDYRRALPT